MKFEIEANVNLAAKPEGGNYAVLALLGELLTEIKKMSLSLTELTDQVTSLESVSDSAVTLLNGLHSKLELALKAGTPPEVQAAVQDLTNRLGTDAKKLAEAITANTIAEPTE